MLNISTKVVSQQISKINILNISFKVRSKPTNFKDESFEHVHQGTTQTQIPNISDDMDTSAAAADSDLDEQAARLESLATHAARQAEIKAEQNMNIARQQAQQLLQDQEQTLRREQPQDAAQAAALTQQVHREAQGATNREKPKKSRMEAEEKEINKQLSKKTKQKVKDEEIRR